MENQYQNLAKRIFVFLDRYAKFAADYNEGEDLEVKYNSPDAYYLLACAQLLEVGKQPNSCWSEYDQGGYIRTNEGRAIHNQLIIEIYQIINCKKPDVLSDPHLKSHLENLKEKLNEK